uniref:Ubiquitin-like protease family profile domain-containing protein n=1 Tax=Setaria italica TaxID=4555 RepID=K3ZNF9_SETIT
MKHYKFPILYVYYIYEPMIDILDPSPRTEHERKEKHEHITQRIQKRLNDIFPSFTNGRFTDFNQWGLPFVPVPKEDALANDCGYLVMMFLEHYDGEKRKLNIDIDTVDLLGSQYVSQLLYYIMFCKRNGKRPFPVDI